MDSYKERITKELGDVLQEIENTKDKLYLEWLKFYSNSISFEHFLADQTSEIHWRYYAADRKVKHLLQSNHDVV